LRLAKQKEPLTVRKVAAGTEVAHAQENYALSWCWILIE
jgi:hypothetical protein